MSWIVSRGETRRVFDEICNAKTGIPSTFVACPIQRRTKMSDGVLEHHRSFATDMLLFHTK
jgi:hypothetical protein